MVLQAFDFIGFQSLHFFIYEIHDYLTTVQLVEIILHKMKNAAWLLYILTMSSILSLGTFASVNSEEEELNNNVISQEETEDSEEEYSARLQSASETRFEQVLQFFDLTRATLSNIDQRLGGVEKSIEKECSSQMTELEGVQAKFRLMESNYLKMYKWTETLRNSQLKEEEDRKRSMLVNARAKLYTEINITGQYETYSMVLPTWKGGCYRLSKVHGRVKSVETQGTCVRIFSCCACTCWSQAIYPGSKVNVDPKLNGVNCIGPCAPNEFDHVELIFTSNSTQIVTKNSDSKTFKNVPDITHDHWNRYFQKSKEVHLPMVSINRYGVGYKNRLEYIYGQIYARHLKTVVESMKSPSALGISSQSVPESFQLAYVFPLEIGGIANESYNIFMQKKNQSIQFQDLIAAPIQMHLGNNSLGYVQLGLTFFYARPYFHPQPATGIWYWLYKSHVDEYSWGYIFN